MVCVLETGKSKNKNNSQNSYFVLCSVIICCHICIVIVKQQGQKASNHTKGVIHKSGYVHGIIIC
jgi:hypothetical protein